MIQIIKDILEMILEFFDQEKKGKTQTPLDPDPQKPEDELADMILTNSPGIGPKMVKMASDWFFHPAITNKDYLVLVDFDYHEANPRMWVVDRHTGKSDVYKVAHGSKSDPDKDGKATEFSNVSGSHQSSLGAMVTHKQYGHKQGGWSKFKYAIKLKGLQPKLNSNVFDRFIVFHSAHYVDDIKGKMIGDSWGCFAVSEQTAEVISDLIDNGALLFAYHKSLDNFKGPEHQADDLSKAVKLIRKWEGYKSEAYLDPAGVWTIGWGTTRYPNGRRVKKGDSIIQSQATDFLFHDIKRVAFKPIQKLVKVPLTNNQLNALVSFTYNVGQGNLGRSTLLKKLNAGDYFGAGQEFHRWNKGGGKVLQGLINRRQDEYNLWIS